MENCGLSWISKILFKTPRKESTFFILKLEIGTVEMQIIKFSFPSMILHSPLCAIAICF